MVKVTLKDGSVKEFEKGIAIIKIVEGFGGRLAKEALAASLNGKLVDLITEINDDSTLEILTFEDNGGKWAMRHTASHTMAQAVKRLFPGVKLAIGPSIENGFYYDFDTERPFTEEDLLKIEKEMDKIVKENLVLEKFILPKNEAIEYVKAQGEIYKEELIRELPEGEEISFYKQGEFTDLCAGPHISSTGILKAYKLMSVAGAYWRGSEKNKMLQRIYGTAFAKKAQLDEYINMIEEAKKRDHNKIGRELELFTTVDYIGQGLPILLPKGAKIIQTLQRFVEDEEERRGYMITKTPMFAKSDLYKISGHWDHYREGMFVMGDESGDEADLFALRPMTCPFQFQAYLNRARSYRDLPMRYAETATLFRNESSGEMHGLIRLRQFTISEGHIACLPSQLETEFAGCIDLANFMVKTVGLQDDVSYQFSKWDPNNKQKYIGEESEWEDVQNRMREILDHQKIDYVEKDGEAAFYGPKLDIQIRNVHGKEDTLITIQIDFQLAEKFGMNYIDSDGQKKFPYVIHRTSIGCYERTLALLIEKYAGAFPAWLAPVQVKVIPVSERHYEYAKSLSDQLKSNNFRVETDYRSEKIGYKIREAQLQKIPYMLIVGDKEVENGDVAVRARKEGDLGSLSTVDFISKLEKEIREKTI